MKVWLDGAECVIGNQKRASGSNPQQCLHGLRKEWHVWQESVGTAKDRIRSMFTLTSTGGEGRGEGYDILFTLHALACPALNRSFAQFQGDWASMICLPMTCLDRC